MRKDLVLEETGPGTLIRHDKTPRLEHVRRASARSPCSTSPAGMLVEEGIFMRERGARLLWRGRVKLICKPADEGGRGANPMGAAGVVDDIDHFAALPHRRRGPPAGPGRTRGDAVLASVRLDAEFHGLASGRAPAGRNATVLGLHALPRHWEDATFVNPGVLHAGTGENIVSHAELRFKVRGKPKRMRSAGEEPPRRVGAVTRESPS